MIVVVIMHAITDILIAEGLLFVLDFHGYVLYFWLQLSYLFLLL